LDMASGENRAPLLEPAIELENDTAGEPVTETHHDDTEEAIRSVFKENRFNSFAFELGVAHAALKVYIFGAYPPYFFLYTVIQFPILVFFVMRDWCGKVKKWLYLFEFCWIANVVLWTYLLYIAVNSLVGGSILPPQMRQSVEQLFFGVANGPLALACVMNGNALVFHDPVRLASLFIHSSPALVSWILRWKRAEVLAVWPDAFHSNDTEMPLYLDPTPYWSAYFLWWGIYGIWLISCGCEWPYAWGYRSSFQDMQPNCAKIYPGSTRNRFALRMQGCVYLVIHSICFAIGFGVAFAVYTSSILHTIFLAIVMLSTVHQGSRHYNFAFGKKMKQQLLTKLSDSEEVASMC